MASLWLTTLGQTDGLTPPLRPESNKSDAPLAAALVAGGTSVLEQIDYSMSLNHSDPKPRPRAAHIWPAHAAGFYIEPHWCSERLFAVEQFTGGIWDCCCGTGRITEAARNAGYHDVIATDLIDRGYQRFNGRVDFLTCAHLCAQNIVCNPAFGLCKQFVRHALYGLDRPANKIAVIWLVRRLNAAHWLLRTPLVRVYLLTPRPSMPPGEVILRGEKPKDGSQDFCWLVFERGHVEPPKLRWLHRDPEHQP